MKKELFSRDFTLVVIGQIVSLFGNAALRFALPLYLLNQTGSSALYGTVSACALIPAILLSPIGGMIADRCNKRNIMVVLDFSTSLVIIGFLFMMDIGGLITRITITLMLLYGIAGVYQPSVQASIPVLVKRGDYIEANSVINTISSFSSLAGPVLGGLLYSVYGLRPILWICAACFFLSAVMEIFIRIPFEKQERKTHAIRAVQIDFKESLSFICKERPVIGKSVCIVCAMNLFLSAMIVVGLPYMITEVLTLPSKWVNTLYGFAQGVMAAGGLLGGICAGILGSRLDVRKAGDQLTVCTIGVFPMGLALLLCGSGMVHYIVILLCGFVIMLLSTLFSIQIMALVQEETPQRLLGKVISVILTISMCAQPLGNLLYGLLFEVLKGWEFIVFLLAGILCLPISLYSRKLFKSL